jgi:hypothetical protein
MTQHDFNIANATFPSVRSDINSALTAINTTQSGTSRPASAVAGTIWLDTTSATTPTLKYYDGADDISLATLDHSANTVNWLDSTVSITGLSSTATGTVLTLTDSDSKSTVNLIIDNQKEVRFNETTANGTNYIGLKAPASVTADLTFTLPVAPTADNQALVSTTAGVMSFTPYAFPSADGTANQVIQTNGTGTLSFATANAGTPNIDTFDTGTAATYTKPTTANWIQINIWGGGGSGSRGDTSDPSGGGGGGAYNTLIVPFSYLVGAVTYTVGAGGAGKTTKSVGNAGGTTSVSIADYNGTGITKTFYAYGGGAGGLNDAGGRGGGGGGIYSAGNSGGTLAYNIRAFSNSATSNGDGGGGLPSRYNAVDTVACPPLTRNGYFPQTNPFGGSFGGGRYVTTLSYDITISAKDMPAIYGGGGGGHAVDGAGTTAADGGSSQYGGGGGGGAANSGTAGVGGTSVYGGNGSDGTVDANASSNGSTPAGGSGGTEGGDSGDGGSGRVQFIYW